MLGLRIDTIVTLATVIFSAGMLYARIMALEKRVASFEKLRDELVKELVRGELKTWKASL